MSCQTHANGSNAGQPCYPTHPAKPMQAISAILNPDTVGRDGEKEKVFIFQSLPNRTVGMDQINFGDKTVNSQKDEGDGVVGYYAKPPSFVPILRSGSKLVSTVFNDIVHVYGINEQTGLISLMSPIFSPVKHAQPEYNNFAACSNVNDDGKGYLYFQKKNEKGIAYIWEKDLSDPDSEPSLVDKTNDAEEGTDMIAFHDGENRWIVYQTSSGRDEKNIVLRGVDNGKTDNIPEFGNNIASGSIARIAVVRDRTANDREDLVFVYLAAAKNQLWRSQATITDGIPKFTSAKKLSKDTYINGWTSMSVVADPVKRENLIFTITEKGNSISLNRDVWGKQ